MDIKVRKPKRVQRQGKVRKKMRKIVHKGDERYHLKKNSVMK